MTLFIYPKCPESFQQCEVKTFISINYIFVYLSLIISLIIFKISIKDEKLEMKKQIESLGLEFDFDAFGFDGEINNNNTDSSASYLKNKISLEEIREISTIEATSVDELEQLFLKSYEEECKPDDLLFDGWKNSFEEEEEYDDQSNDEGDYWEPCQAELIPETYFDESNLCRSSM